MCRVFETRAQCFNQRVRLGIQASNLFVQGRLVGGGSPCSGAIQILLHFQLLPCSRLPRTRGELVNGLLLTGVHVEKEKKKRTPRHQRLLLPLETHGLLKEGLHIAPQGSCKVSTIVMLLLIVEILHDLIQTLYTKTISILVVYYIYICIR